jgi:hypothetical protein
MKPYKYPIEVDILASLCYFGGTTSIWKAMYQWAYMGYSSSAYNLEPVIFGEKLLFKIKARWYSPTFWLPHLISMLALVFLSIPLMLYHSVHTIRQELRGGYRKAQNETEKNYIRFNAAPPNDYQI